MPTAHPIIENGRPSFHTAYQNNAIGLSQNTVIATHTTASTELLAALRRAAKARSIWEPGTCTSRTIQPSNVQAQRIRLPRSRHDDIRKRLGGRGPTET